jgi:hypothetical protein
VILTDCRIVAGAAYLSGQQNRIEVAPECEEKPTTNFLSQGWAECIGGISGWKLAGGGQWAASDAQAVDQSRWNAQGAAEYWSIAPGLFTAGERAYLGTAMQSKYTFLGELGEVAPWAIDASGSGALVQGRSLHSNATARTATGSGTAVQLQAVDSSHALYCALHVLSVSGTATPTLTVRVQSDNAGGFPSATTVQTFTAATAVGAQFARVAGPITDDWFRADWTISGTNPSFLFVVTIGVGP